MTGGNNAQNRGDDAADHVPPDSKPEGKALESPQPQDAPNYDVAVDGGRAVPVADLNSANDE
jgi:hypothetical protein